VPEAPFSSSCFFLKVVCPHMYSETHMLLHGSGPAAGTSVCGLWDPTDLQQLEGLLAALAFLLSPLPLGLPLAVGRQVAALPTQKALLDVPGWSTDLAQDGEVDLRGSRGPA